MTRHFVLTAVLLVAFCTFSATEASASNRLGSYPGGVHVGAGPGLVVYPGVHPGGVYPGSVYGAGVHQGRGGGSRDVGPNQVKPGHGTTIPDGR
jgi:hypothetical protein